MERKDREDEVESLTPSNNILAVETDHSGATTGVSCGTHHLAHMAPFYSPTLVTLVTVYLVQVTNAMSPVTTNCTAMSFLWMPPIKPWWCHVIVPFHHLYLVKLFSMQIWLAITCTYGLRLTWFKKCRNHLDELLDLVLFLFDSERIN